MSLTTLEQVKIYLGIAQSNTDEDDKLDAMRDGLEASFKRLTARDIESQPYVDYYSGNWSSVIRLFEYPVTTVTNVWLDEEGFYGAPADAFGASSLLTQGTDYVVARDDSNGTRATGRLLRLKGVWPGRWQFTSGGLCARRIPGQGNVKVSYTAGYLTVPMDIQMAIWQLMDRMRSGAGTGGGQVVWEQEEDVYYRIQPLSDSLWLKDQGVMGSPGSVLRSYRRISSKSEVLT